jgi:hypothetical protein
LREKLPDDLPIAVAGQIIDLMNRGCVGTITDLIRQAEDRFGCGVGLAVFDTYSKGIAAGGGDENQAKDQNIAVANLRRIIDATNIHIAGVGHTGKDENKGERGSNARLADVDVQVQLSGADVKNAVVTKANDQPEGPLTGFRLEPFEFGLDEDGDAFRTYIVSKEIFAGAAASNRVMSDRQRLAMSALSEVVLSRGRPPPAEYSLPQGIRVVTGDDWRTELLRQGVLDAQAGNPRARYSELRNSLKARQLIGSRDEWVWPALSNGGNSQ